MFIGLNSISENAKHTHTLNQSPLGCMAIPQRLECRGSVPANSHSPQTNDDSTELWPCLLNSKSNLVTARISHTILFFSIRRLRWFPSTRYLDTNVVMSIKTCCVKPEAPKLLWPSKPNVLSKSNLDLGPELNSGSSTSHSDSPAILLEPYINMTCRQWHRASSKTMIVMFCTCASLSLSLSTLSLSLSLSIYLCVYVCVCAKRP